MSALLETFSQPELPKTSIPEGSRAVCQQCESPVVVLLALVLLAPLTSRMLLNFFGTSVGQLPAAVGHSPQARKCTAFPPIDHFCKTSAW
jgi:hypothetical protein